MEEQKKTRNNISRRKFIKGGAVLGAAAGLAAVTGNNAGVKQNATNFAKAIGVKQLDEIPLEIDDSKLERFDDKNKIFNRGFQDPEFYPTIFENPGIINVVDNTRIGYTQVDYAFYSGAHSTLNKVRSILYGYDDVYPVFGEKYKFASKADASKAIKRISKFYGADLVGITKYDERWMFKDFDPMPFEPKSAICIAVEMDYLGISAAPSMVTEGTVGLKYSNLMEISYKIASFMKALGYDAMSYGHSQVLHVPYAVAAGLGELGRNGILITYEYGPRVRLVEIITEFDFVEYDKPVSFGAWDFCQVCKKCAMNCPSESISMDDEPSWEVPTISAIPGVKRYTLNAETCYKYWTSIGNGCAACITSCPFNKPDFWHHRITTALTSTPLKPFLNEMDDLFGYGDLFNEQACIDFWNYED